MPGLAVGILVFTLVVCAGATIGLCAAIERHSRRSGRRELFGLAPLDLP